MNRYSSNCLDEQSYGLTVKSLLQLDTQNDIWITLVLPVPQVLQLKTLKKNNIKYQIISSHYLFYYLSYTLYVYIYIYIYIVTLYVNVDMYAQVTD